MQSQYAMNAASVSTNVGEMPLAEARPSPYEQSSTYLMCITDTYARTRQARIACRVCAASGFTWK